MELNRLKSLTSYSIKCSNDKGLSHLGCDYRCKEQQMLIYNYTISDCSAGEIPLFYLLDVWR